MLNKEVRKRIPADHSPKSCIQCSDVGAALGIDPESNLLMLLEALAERTATDGSFDARQPNKDRQ